MSVDELSAEERLLLAVVRRQVTTATELPNAIDVQTLCELARYHFLLPEVADACRASATISLEGSPDLSMLFDAARQSLDRTRQLIDATAAVIDALAVHMPVLLAKGVYIRDVAHLTQHRTMGDIDVYIDESHVDEALLVCERLGVTPRVSGSRRDTYRRNRGQFELLGNGAKLDLHWWLNNNPLHRITSEFALNSVMAGAVSTCWRGISVLTPSPEDALLLNVLYMTYENWGHRLRMYVDHSRLAQAVDPSRARARAEHLGLSKALQLTLHAASLVTGLRLDDSWGEMRLDVHDYREAFAIIADGPGKPSRASTWATKSIDERKTFNRFLIRINEYARVLRLTDRRHVHDVLRTLVLPAEQARYLYLSDGLWTRAVHPLALALGSATVAWRIAAPKLREPRTSWWSSGEVPA